MPVPSIDVDKLLVEQTMNTLVPEFFQARIAGRHTRIMLFDPCYPFLRFHLSHFTSAGNPA